MSIANNYRLALLQLKEISDNAFIIIDGKTLDIQSELDILGVNSPVDLTGHIKIHDGMEMYYELNKHSDAYGEYTLFLSPNKTEIVGILNLFDDASVAPQALVYSIDKQPYDLTEDETRKVLAYRLGDNFNIADEVVDYDDIALEGSFITLTSYWKDKAEFILPKDEGKPQGMSDLHFKRFKKAINKLKKLNLTSEAFDYITSELGFTDYINRITNR